MSVPARWATEADATERLDTTDAAVADSDAAIAVAERTVDPFDDEVHRDCADSADHSAAASTISRASPERF